VRIGIIGCGGRARDHMRALAAHPLAQVVAVADISPEAAERAGTALGVPWYTDHRRLLERTDLDAAWLSVPVSAHGPAELEIIGRGLPFFVEKPVARHLETGIEIAEALERAGLWAAVGYQLRYETRVRTAHAFVAGRTVATAEGHYWCGTGRQAGRWITDWEQSGGQLVEQATHTVDLLRHLVGEVEEVYALQAHRVLKEITSPDAYAVVLRFRNGALGTLNTGWTHDPGEWSEANVVHLLLDGCLVELGSRGVVLQPARAGELAEVTGPDMYGAFLAAVRSGDPVGAGVLSPYRDALATLAVSLAANTSAESGRPEAVTVRGA
jgi:predicted dehydrogenase